MMHETSKTIALRPHHGLCLNFFIGLGYSERFVQRMTWLQKELERNPLIELVSGTDVLCDACPNTQGESCSDEKRFSAYDAALLKMTALQTGRVIRWKQFKERMQERVFDEGRFHEICPDCQWHEFCHK
jgi:hypothetical protein